MVNGYRPGARLLSRAGLGLILLVLLVLPAILPGQARAQQAFTPTATVQFPRLFQPQATLVAPPIQITRSVPTFVVTDVRVSNLETTALTSLTNETTADLAFQDQFKATINIQSPSSMRMGESRVITLEVIPELLAQASMVRADLLAIKFESLDDGQPEKTVLVNTPVRWNWNIAPKEAGEQEFFLSLSYVNSQGSRVHWQNVILQVAVSQIVTPTNGVIVTLTDTQVFTPTHTAILDTQTPTWTPSPTNLPEETPVFTLTPTETIGRRLSDDVAENPATYLGILVTLVLGLLTVYFQHIRKKDK
jgi:hypothetical protein